MNAERLLDLFDRVVEGPDAVARLRRFVLDLAVRGKLVEQDPGDESASELLKRIAAEKERLVNAGKIRKSKPFPKVDVQPFSVPSSWRWLRLGEIGITQTGTTPSKRQPENFGGDIPFIKPNDIHLTHVDYSNEGLSWAGAAVSGRIAPRGSVFMVCIGTIGKCQLIDRPSSFNQQINAVSPYADTNSRFILYCLKSSYFQDAAWAASARTTISILNKGKWERLPIPVPPLAEQRRIVSKVDELMAVCDRMKEARTAGEDTRDRLTKASLTRLNAPDTDAPTFRSHARFTVDALPALTARADQVKHLRQAILNLAVRGKLVDQDPADEPLPCIDRAIPPDLEPPFQIPATWRWSRLRALGTLKGGGTPSKARGDFWNGSIPWVSPKEMKLDYIAKAQMRVTEAAVAASAVNVIEPESILFVVRGMILAHSFPVAISRVPVTINQDMKAIILKKPDMAEYLLRALKALKPEMVARVRRSSHGTCRITGTDYGDFMIPLPPFAEQHRIVAKVDELMALCDRMATGLAAADDTRTRLLDYLLHDALASAAYEAVTTRRLEARNTRPEWARSGGVPSRS